MSFIVVLDCNSHEAQNDFMEDRLLELLEFPRKLVHGELELEDCPHAGFYDLRDIQCINCTQGPECHWLCRNDEYASLQNHTTDELIEALDFACCYVYSAIIKWDHKPETCNCVVCQWHRKARAIYDEITASKKSA